MNMKNLVAIVGRPNVGKSTLYNRLTQSREAIVDDVAGTTRDRQYGKVEWGGREFSIVDTGGLVANSDDIFEDQINRQVNIAIEESDLILFVVDIINGITDYDEKVARILRKSNKNVILVSNKADNFNLYPQSAEFYSFGLGDPMNISAISGAGTGDLLDAILEKMPERKEEEELEDIPKIAIVGRPNAGKSSILNALLDEERNIVTNISGTTRDSIYTKFNKFNMNFYLVDTAGIRKKAKVNEDIEYYSVLRSIRAIENSDVCILVIDATKGIEAQDLNIFSVIQKNRKGLVVCVNKWDLVENKEQIVVKTFEKAIKERLAPFTDFPLIFTSAITKQRILKLLEVAKEVYDVRKTKVPTNKLNEVLLDIIAKTPPPAIKGKYIKIKYITQLPKTHVPTFVFFCNLPNWVKEPYRRFLENQIRKHWNFCGTPINILMREK